MGLVDEETAISGLADKFTSFSSPYKNKLGSITHPFCNSMVECLFNATSANSSDENTLIKLPSTNLKEVGIQGKVLLDKICDTLDGIQNDNTRLLKDIEQRERLSIYADTIVVFERYATLELSRKNHRDIYINIPNLYESYERYSHFSKNAKLCATMMNLRNDDMELVLDKLTGIKNVRNSISHSNIKDQNTFEDVLKNDSITNETVKGVLRQINGVINTAVLNEYNGVTDLFTLKEKINEDIKKYKTQLHRTKSKV